jgi:hypothetical protein
MEVDGTRLMPKEITLTAEDTAELQRLYAELPGAIADAAQASHSEQLSGQAVAMLLEGDEKDEKIVDTIIKRICQLTQPEANQELGA